MAAKRTDLTALCDAPGGTGGGCAQRRHERVPAAGQRRVQRLAPLPARKVGVQQHHDVARRAAARRQQPPQAAQGAARVLGPAQDEDVRAHGATHGRRVPLALHHDHVRHRRQRPDRRARLAGRLSFCGAFGWSRVRPSAAAKSGCAGVQSTSTAAVLRPQVAGGGARDPARATGWLAAGSSDMWRPICVRRWQLRKLLRPRLRLPEDSLRRSAPASQTCVSGAVAARRRLDGRAGVNSVPVTLGG